MAEVRVLVVDDFAPWRELVISAFRTRENIQIVGEASDGWSAIAKAVELHPDLVVLDIGLPDLSGIEVARRIRESAPQTRILFLTENTTATIVDEALHVGAHAYVVKSSAASDLMPALDAVLHGNLFVSRSAAHPRLRHCSTCGDACTN